MRFHIKRLAPEQFAPLFALDDAALARVGAVRQRAASSHGAPCRVSLTDAAEGEELLLLNWEHQPAATPFRSRHAIYVREAASMPFDGIDTSPPVFAGRMLSLRCFDDGGMMVTAELVQGEESAPTIRRLLGLDSIAYIHAHFAAYGCFACRIDRG